MGASAQELRASFVTPWYGDKVPGGAEAEARRTAQNLARAGLRVQVLTTCLAGLGTDWDRDQLPAGLTMEKGVSVRRFPTAKRDGARFNVLNSRVMAGQRLSIIEEHDFFRNMVYSPAILDYIAQNPQEGPFFFIPYLFTSSVLGPLIHPAKSVLIPCLHDEGYARLSAVRRAFEACRAIVFHVPAERDLAGGLYDLKKTEPLVMGEGVDTEWSAQAERFRQKFGLNGPFILYAGRKDPGKNIPLLTRFFLRYVAERQGAGGLKLVMIGNLTADIPPGAKDIILDLGFLSLQDKYDAYAAASVFVQPSVLESFSLVIMEAWLANTPVLVHSGCAVTKEHVEKSAGGLHFNDYPHFAECLDLLLNRPELAERMAAAGRKYVLNNYAWPVITDRFTGLIERLAAEPVPAAQSEAGPAIRPRPKTRRPARPAVHQMLADFAYGDAIGNDVLAIQKALRAAGLESEIFAQHVHPRLQNRALSIEAYGDLAGPEDVLIFHFSTGHPLADVLPSLPGRKVMRYHNITPAHFLEGINAQAAQRSLMGREQLRRLAPSMELGLGVSAYNCKELAEAGCPQAAEVPILLDLEVLQTPPDKAVLRRFADGGPNILHVGRVAPNKCLHDLIKAHYWLKRLIPGARLILVGTGDRRTPYGEGLRNFVEEMGLKDVHFAGHVTTAALMAYYRAAHLYLCLSEHEGFCVPLVEAMHFRLPILAHASTGVPGTLDGGGVLLLRKDPVFTAELIARILGDSALRGHLSSLARARLDAFLPERVAQRLKDVLQERLGLNIDHGA